LVVVDEAHHLNADEKGGPTLEYQLLEKLVVNKLMENEEPRLRELLAAADKVRKETKIDTIVSILQNEYGNRKVLLFTEYKATQSLLMSASR